MKARDMLRYDAVIKLYMEMFGQRSRSDMWTSERDMVKKDYLETETESPMEKQNMRVHRIGQTQVQNIYIATCNYSWDQRQQARAALKMYGQIAGQAEIEILDDIRPSYSK
ncbi:hypothetical protein ACLOAV_009116 [Pseudogymnoascus australis]